jgi:hypothetical protein
VDAFRSDHKCAISGLNAPTMFYFIACKNSVTLCRALCGSNTSAATVKGNGGSKIIEIKKKSRSDSHTVLDPPLCSKLKIGSLDPLASKLNPRSSPSVSP